MAAIVDLRSLDSGISYCRTASSLHSYSSAISTNTTDNERLTPRTFLERYSLPRVVRIVSQEPVEEGAERGGLMSLLSGELLMYQQYRSGKVEASSLTKSKNGERIVSSVVIPDTYQGWFSVVTERHQVKARCYNSIQRLVSARVTIFLTMSEVIGYTQNNCRTNSGGMRQQYSKMVLKCGSVLKLLAVYQDITSESTARSKRLSWPLIGRHETNRYAQCLSSNDQVVFISVTQHGQFYAVATASGTSDDTVSKVYQLPKLLRTFPLPVRVCIVTPNKPQGSMLLESYRKEDVILTCLLDSCAACMQEQEHADEQGAVSSTQFRLLEMDVDSKFYVVKLGPRELDEKRLFHSGLVQRGLRFCRENHEAWARQLKFIHHIYPRNCEDVPAVAPKKSSAKPARKISLGDKKTVKSASFRFSTSFPEDLRPVKHPVPRKPNQKPRKNESRTFMESSPSNDTSYYTNNEEFYNEIYSNVPDADNYVNYRENNKNVKETSEDRLGAVNNSLHEGLGYVHYSNQQEVEKIDDHQRGYEELITFQSNKKVENTKLNDESESKNRHVSNNVNESSGKEKNIIDSSYNALESYDSSDVVTGEYRAGEERGLERRQHMTIESSDRVSQQIFAFGKNSPVDSKKSSMISSQSSYYCYNKTVEDVGRNFSKLMLFNDRQSSVKSKTSLKENGNTVFKGESSSDNKPVSQNFDARASYKDFERSRMDRSGVSGKLELSRAGRNQDSYSVEDRKELANRSIDDEKYFADEIPYNSSSNVFSPASRSSDKSQPLVNRGDFLETSHRTVWASPVSTENSIKETVTLECGADSNQHKSTDVGSVKLSASPLRVGRPFSTGIKPPSNDSHNKVVGEFENRIKKQVKPAPVVPRTRTRTAQQRQIRAVEPDDSGSPINPPVFVSTAVLHTSSPRAIDCSSLASFKVSTSGNELKDEQDGDIESSKNSSDLSSAQILRRSRRSESRQTSPVPVNQKFSSTQKQPHVIERRNIDRSDHGNKRRAEKGGVLGNDKTPESDSQSQSRYNNDEVTNSRMHNQQGSKRFENSRVSVLHDTSRTNRPEESVSKLSNNSNSVNVDNGDRKAANFSGVELNSRDGRRNVQKMIDDNWSLKNENDFKTKIMIDDCRYGVIGAKNAGKPAESGSEGAVSAMYRVVRKPVPCASIIKPFYKTRVQIGPDFCSSTDVPYSVVVDQISTATDVGSTEENIYAEIAGDSYQSPSRYFSKLTSTYDYRANGGSDGTFSNTTTSSSNADESSV